MFSSEEAQKVYANSLTAKLDNIIRLGDSPEIKICQNLLCRIFCELCSTKYEKGYVAVELVPEEISTLFTFSVTGYSGLFFIHHWTWFYGSLVLSDITIRKIACQVITSDDVSNPVPSQVILKLSWNNPKEVRKAYEKAVLLSKYVIERFNHLSS